MYDGTEKLRRIIMWITMWSNVDLEAAFLKVKALKREVSIMNWI